MLPILKSDSSQVSNNKSWTHPKGSSAFLINNKLQDSSSNKLNRANNLTTWATTEWFKTKSSWTTPISRINNTTLLKGSRFLRMIKGLFSSSLRFRELIAWINLRISYSQIQVNNWELAKIYRLLILRTWIYCSKTEELSFKIKTGWLNIIFKLLISSHRNRHQTMKWLSCFLKMIKFIIKLKIQGRKSIIKDKNFKTSCLWHKRSSP